MEQQIPAKTRTETKTKRRGFVMTGGGAKGLYEAGVINAFHLTGMEFDVITGSSIGAMNSIFFAEYLLNKKILAEKIPDDDPGKPLKLIEQMEESDPALPPHLAADAHRADHRRQQGRGHK